MREVRERVGFVGSEPQPKNARRRLLFGLVARPGEIIAAAPFDRKHDKAWQFITMDAPQSLDGPIDKRAPCLEESREFGALFELSLPHIDAGHFRIDVHAGGKLLVDRKPRRGSSAVEIGVGGIQKAELIRGYGHLHLPVLV